jgi:ArsR family transcriptional regulator
MKSAPFDAFSQPELRAAASLLEALAHPLRLRIVDGLLDGACSVNPMVDTLGLPQALVSRHLAILREAGVVEAEAEGRKRVYRVIHPAVAPLVVALHGSFCERNR